MNPIVVVIVVYLVALAINVLLLRYDVGGLRGWLAMLADSRHGLLLNAVALIVLFVPPVLYLMLLHRLYRFLFRAT